MCFSVKSKQNPKGLGKQFGAKPDTPAFLDLFAARLTNERIIIPPAMEFAFLTPEGKAEEKIKKLILTWYEQEQRRIEEKIFDYKKQITALDAKLRKNETKTNRASREAKMRQIKRFKDKLKANKPLSKSSGWGRIFPRQYTSAVVFENGKLLVKPLRYGVFRQTRVMIKDIIDDQEQDYVLYNCKRESLNSERFSVVQGQIERQLAKIKSDAKTQLKDLWQGNPTGRKEKTRKEWIAKFMDDYALCESDLDVKSIDTRSIWERPALEDHALIVVQNFYEIVAQHDFEGRALRSGEKETYITLEFSPEPQQEMFFPALRIKAEFSENKYVDGLSIITDKPNPEVAEKGHNRTPIALDQNAAMDFLKGKADTIDDLQSILDQKVSFYFNAALAA